MKNAYKVLFIGIDAKVFDLLKNDSRVELMGTNVVLDFLTFKTNNPIDYLFKWSYSLHIHHKFSGLKYLLFAAGQLFKDLSSDLYRQFCPYFNTIIRNNIPVIDFDDLKQVQTFVEKYNIDVFVMSNWWMLSEEIINLPRFRTVNIHPSPLPKYRGSVPTLWSLKYKDPDTAVSFMVIDPSMDGGNLIAQHEIEITYTDDALSLEDKCDEQIKKHFVTDLVDYLEDKIELKTQDKSKVSLTAKYFPYMKIDCSHESVSDVVNKILLYPHLWPPDKCYAILNERKIHIKNAVIKKSLDKYSLNPGSYRIKGLFLEVDCRDGIFVSQLFRDISWINSVVLIMSNSKTFN